MTSCSRECPRTFFFFWALILINNLINFPMILLMACTRMCICTSCWWAQDDYYCECFQTSTTVHETPQASFPAFSSPLYNTLSSSVDAHKPCSYWKLAKEFPLFICVCDCLFVCLQLSCNKLSPCKFFLDHLELLYILQNSYFSLPYWWEGSYISRLISITSTLLWPYIRWSSEPNA